LIAFHQMVDARRKFTNRASKVIMLQNNRNSRLQENLFIYKQSLIRNPGFREKMEDTRVLPGRPSRTTGWETLR